MSINDFAKKVTEYEGKKIEISIAQVKEVLSIINTITGGLFYVIIKNWVKE